jgi:hypothetical protein
MATPPRAIAPDSAPGGLVFVITAGGYVWRERRFPLEAGAAAGVVEAGAGADAELCGDLAERFGEACQTVYDGDTGEAVARYTVTPE